MNEYGLLYHLDNTIEGRLRLIINENSSNLRSAFLQLKDAKENTIRTKQKIIKPRQTGAAVEAAC